MLRTAHILVLTCVIATPGVARAGGVFLEDDYRWANKNVLIRSGLDVVAIPANVVNWEATDWVQFAAWTAAVAGLTFVGNPVWDVQLDRWITANMDPIAPVIWTDPMQVVLWGSIVVGGFSTWGWAWLTGNDDVAQGLSLMGEALAVSQVYHLTFKLLIGREGPTNGEGNAEILGPANALKVYPAGTPSGHAATLMSLMSAGFAYFHPPAWVQAIGYTATGFIIGFHVINHRHFLSDSLWGGAMGWYVGQWVVKHRASWLFGERNEARVHVVPFATDRMSGLAISGIF